MSSLIIAAAGAGKTTFLVKQALKISENILITTFTDANEQSIREKFYEINGCIPSNVTIMPWFSLLIKHGIRPYQSYLINTRISGVALVKKADKNLLKLRDTNEKKYITASEPVIHAADLIYRRVHGNDNGWPGFLPGLHAWCCFHCSLLPFPL